MPKKQFHNGFIEYTRTPQENKVARMEKELNELKDLKDILSGINPEDLKNLINKKGGKK